MVDCILLLMPFGEDAAGGPRTLEFGLDLPSIGVAYRAVPKWLFSVDVRYLDYDNADGFGDSATFNPDGSLNGLCRTRPT